MKKFALVLYGEGVISQVYSSSSAQGINLPLPITLLSVMPFSFISMCLHSIVVRKSRISHIIYIGKNTIQVRKRSGKKLFSGPLENTSAAAKNKSRGKTRAKEIPINVLG
ncbi:MAG: hypothetical protein IJX27_05405 [Clostridia bacterium]|nr:hypothetical protein [Clostridia bacterium]